ncbi:MAG: glucose-1-phosphate adenylyltransferase [Rhodopirellula sp.]|nr:glucose-1-phosphate adenylyltransferase [Rhodopirellula sp.]
MKDVLTLVLGGGQGTRLYPLTKFRSKPAVPVGGKYRLIDIPLSNCIHSGLNHIYVLTQFNSVSLHHHIRSTYNFDVFGRGFVEILAAQQTFANGNWYQGTADAVRQNLRYIQQRDVSEVLILSGDQLYRMDFREMIEAHRQSGADVTIAAVPVHSRDAASLGIMRVDREGRVEGFLEKPQTEEELALVRTDPAWIDAHGIPSGGRDCLANMGIYLFNRKTLVDVLEKTDYRDFGREVFPASIRSRRVQMHLTDGYWEDIGTIRAFYEANLTLARKTPPFPLLAADAPVYSRARFLPPSRLDGVTVRGSLIADGCTIGEGTVIENSVIGLRCVIGSDVVVRNSILMGYDFYEEDNRGPGRRNGCPALGIGPGARIHQAIIDKNCAIGRNVQIVNSDQLDATDETEHAMICDGIVVVPKGATIPDGWAL